MGHRISVVLLKLIQAGLVSESVRPRLMGSDIMRSEFDVFVHSLQSFPSLQQFVIGHGHKSYSLTDRGMYYKRKIAAMVKQVLVSRLCFVR
jgi:hypothetical protein